MRAIAVTVVLNVLLSAAPAAAQVDSDTRERQQRELERVREMQANGRAGRSADLASAESHRHTGGYFRIDAGYGYMASSLVALGEVKFSGPAGLFGLHVGGAVQENAILGIHTYGLAIQDPKFSMEGESGTATDETISVFGVGPELTVYFMPSNTYVTTSVAMTKLTHDTHDLSGAKLKVSSDWGLGGHVALGKEWWVSKDWGLGLAGQLSFSSNQVEDEGIKFIYQSWSAGLVFSATYN